MAKEVKAKEEIKEKKCGCGPDCKCGCQEGKECTCCNRECHCGCCCRCKRFWGKLLFLALVFFAGMGVNQFMNDTCMWRCPARKGMRAMPMMQMPKMHGNMPFYKDGNGNTIVIVNAGEEAAKHGSKCGPDCKCGHHKHGKHHFMNGMPHDDMPMPEQSDNQQSEE